MAKEKFIIISDENEEVPQSNDTYYVIASQVHSLNISEEKHSLYPLYYIHINRMNIKYTNKARRDTMFRYLLKLLNFDVVDLRGAVIYE